jgi:hypothetical protein
VQIDSGGGGRTLGRGKKKGIKKKIAQQFFAARQGIKAHQKNK